MTTENNNNTKEIITADVSSKNLERLKKFIANFSSDDIEIMINNLLSVTRKNHTARSEKYRK